MFQNFFGRPTIVGMFRALGGASKCNQELKKGKGDGTNYESCQSNFSLCWHLPTPTLTDSQWR